MDHFNATIKDGKLVNTRRGLQVSRQKFKGTSFVNSCPQNFVPSTQSSRSRGSSDLPRKGEQCVLKFVEKDKVPRQHKVRPERQVTVGTSTVAFEMTQRRKQARTATTKDHQYPSPLSSEESSGGSSRSSSLAPSTEEAPRSLSVPFPNQQAYLCHQESEMDLSLLRMDLGPERPSHVSPSDWKRFHHCYELVPRWVYPYEDIITYNPARGTDFYYPSCTDVTALHCALMSGSIIEAVLGQEADTRGYTWYMSKICSVLNQRLDRGDPPDAVIICCIATLASNARYVGRLDHWRLHMLGLRKALDTYPVNVGDYNHPVCQTWQISKTADLKGAVALATTPYLPLSPQYPPASVILPGPIRSQAAASFPHILAPLLPPSSPVPAVLASLSILASTVRLARHSAGAVAFDPHHLNEESLSVAHQLLTNPCPLREACGDGDDNPFISGGSNSSAPSARPVDSYMANHRLRPGAHIVPWAGSDSLEAALRISGLLYLKELLPDWPRNLGGYAVLLELLRQHVDAVMLQGAIDPLLDMYGGGGGGNDDDPYCEYYSHTPVRGRDTTTASWKDAAFIAASPKDAHERRRAALVFVCLVGNTVSLVADQNEGRYLPGDRYRRDVYQRCLRDVLGGGGETMRRESDFALLRLLDMRNIKGEKWDDRVALENLLEEHLGYN